MVNICFLKKFSKYLILTKATEGFFLNMVKRWSHLSIRGQNSSFSPSPFKNTCT